jgi:hypothetical protein
MLKKRKEEAKQSRNAARAQNEAQLTAALEKAEITQDPAEKILKLRDVKQAAITTVSNEDIAAQTAGEKSFSNAFLGTSGATTATLVGGTVATLATGGVGMLAALPVMMAGSGISIKRHYSVEKKFNEEAASYKERMTSIAERAAALIDEAAVPENVKAIFDSPKYAEIRETLPDVCVKLADAAREQFSAEKAAAEEEARKNAEQNRREPPAAAEKKAEKRADYDRLKAFTRQ